MKKKIPNRTCSKTYKNYRAYKPYLVIDFNHTCGYCDDNDKWLGGDRNYHIDHFCPKSLFDELENEYNNLVYSCPFCNISKSNDWVTASSDESIDKALNVGYIDPCNPDYIKHFTRLSDGTIKPVTDIGEYMWRKLKFYLKRHQVIYQMNEIFQLKKELRRVLKNNTSGLFENELNYLFLELDQAFDDYFSFVNE